METTDFASDATVMYVTATTFPEGIQQAHETLHTLVPLNGDRKYFGISRPEEGPVVYRAAATELYPGEAATLGLETLVLKKGTYLSVIIRHYRNNPENIGMTFREMLEEPNLDPEGYCVESYLSDEDVQCMIRLRD